MSAPHDYVCPVSLEPMEEPVILSDGTRYDAKSIVPWLLRQPTSPLTTVRVSYRLVRDYALQNAIRQAGLRAITRLDRSIEGERMSGWHKKAEMGETEWREYLVLRRLYWLLRFRESPIPESERVYINYNNPVDGLGAIFDEHPNQLEYPFQDSCPNRFTTLWTIVRRDDIRGMATYMYAHPDAIHHYLMECGWRKRWSMRPMLWWLRAQSAGGRLRRRIRESERIRTLVEFFWNSHLPVIPFLFVGVCLVYAFLTFLLSHAWIFSLTGYPFIIAVSLSVLLFFIH